jgi:glycine hydroxymethyltransferase
MLAACSRSFRSSSVGFRANIPLQEFDEEVYTLIQKETKRQFQCLELIASENFASLAALQAMGTHIHNKYAEGYPGARYYGGNTYTDAIETLCQNRALSAFKLNPAEWGVNVQAYSGSPANVAVFTALIPVGGRIMGLALADGGHLTHGHRKGFNNISASSKFWQTFPIRVDPKTSLLNYAELDVNAKLFNPHIIIAGTSAYPRHLDYAAFRRTADSVGAILMADMAHIAGLVSAGLAPSPFEYCDVVTTTTHKTLRGVRGAMIFYRKGDRKVGKKRVPYDFERRINAAVFPGLQGGPHMHQIAGITVAFKDVVTPEFKEYQRSMIANMKALANYLSKNGIKLVTGGTDTHLALLDLRDQKIDGSKFEWILDAANITVNKNTIPGDTNAGQPRGIRVGAPALTSRGLKEKDFEQVGALILRGLDIGKRIKAKKLAAFKQAVEGNPEVEALKKDVIAFATTFPLPGVTDPDRYR